MVLQIHYEAGVQEGGELVNWKENREDTAQEIKLELGHGE